MMAITFLPVLVLEASLSTERSQTSSIGFYRPRHCSGQPIIQITHQVMMRAQHSEGSESFSIYKYSRHVLLIPIILELYCFI
ncbi:hypothetical protein ERO13_D07G082280v2 [Gossypium hirsutum]|nr:hypothetical protein ERO13_D07G082280v2 [Gossypium hirsutum]